MNLQTFYAELVLDRRGDVDGDLQRRAATYALRNGDTDMLTRLLERPDLDPRADACIAASSDIRVLVPWLLRPGRPVEQIIERVGREHRVTVLTALATTPGLPQQVYVDLARHPSERVLRKIVVARDAPEEARRTALRGIVTRPGRGNKTWKTVDALRELVAESGIPGPLWEEIGEHSLTLPHLLAVTIYSAPTNAHIERWTRRLADIHDHEGGRWRNLTGSLVVDLAGRSLTANQHHRLLRATRDILSTPGARGSDWYAELEHAGRLLQNYPVQTEQGIRRFSAERDPERAASMLEHLHHSCRGKQKHRLLTAAVTHPALPADAVFALRDDLDAAAVRDLARRLEHEGRRDLLDAWLADSRSSSYAPMFITHLDRPAQIIDAHLDAEAAAGRNWPAWTIHTHAPREDPRRALENLPWEVIANAASNAAGLATAITEALTKALGDDDDRWQTFETIGTDYTGTLTELLAAVDALTP